ncbi:MAG: universal stress protein [bacterium]|nr:universal stress protein [bacterium]
MTFKVILIPFSGLDAEIPGLRMAVSEAQDFAAQAVALHCRQLFNSPASAMLNFPLPDGYPSGIETDFLSEAQRTEEYARNLFCEVSEMLNVVNAEPDAILTCGAASFVVVDGEPASILVTRARSADLIVLPLGNRSEGHAELRHEALFKTGLPVLFVPVEWRSFLRPHKVFIAWNGSFEAARAVRLALPFLKGAQVAIFTAAEEDEMPCEGKDIAQYLCHHGVQVTKVETAQVEKDVTASILAAAASFDANLLVMGAFCRETRLRESLLGGFTTDVLAKAEIPVLMAN